MGKRNYLVKSKLVHNKQCPNVINEPEEKIVELCLPSCFKRNNILKVGMKKAR